MTTDLKIIEKAMEEQDFTIEEVAKLTGIRVERLHHIFEENKEATWKELLKIRNVVHFDVNKVLNIKTVDNQYMFIDDELECHVNEITRQIPERNRAYFVKALEYLAECFEDKKKKKKK